MPHENVSKIPCQGRLDAWMLGCLKEKVLFQVASKAQNVTKLIKSALHFFPPAAKRWEQRCISSCLFFFFFHFIDHKPAELLQHRGGGGFIVPAIPTFLENTHINPKINIMRFSAGCHLCETQWGVHLVCLGRNLKSVFTSGKKTEGKNVSSKTTSRNRPFAEVGN